MSRRFSEKELALARRIQEGLHKEIWERACNPPPEISVREQLQRIMDAPLQPSYGPTPPWWEQAIAEADENMVWVNGGGWLRKDLWEDLLSTAYTEDDFEKET